MGRHTGQAEMGKERCSRWGKGLSKSLEAGLHSHGEESQLAWQVGCSGRRGCRDMNPLDCGDFKCFVLKVAGRSR